MKKINVVYLHNILDSSLSHDYFWENSFKNKYNYHSVKFANHYGSKLNLQREINAEKLKNQIIDISCEIDDEIVFIVDGLTILLFVDAYMKIAKYVKKVIYLNPIDMSIFYKTFYIKKYFFPHNFKQLMYKQNTMFKDMNTVIQNELWISTIKKELTNARENNLFLTILTNELFSLSYLHNHIYKIKKIANLTVISPEDNFFNTKGLDANLYNEIKNIYTIMNCGNNILWENASSYFKLIEKIIK